MSEEYQVGERRICSQCGEFIIFTGPAWDHPGEIKPKHPALPAERQSVVIDLDKFRARMERQRVIEFSDVDLLFTLIDEQRARAQQAEALALTLQQQRDQAEADAAALKQPKTQLTNALDSLVGLINEWNDAAEDGDRGRDNKMLVLTLWDDGSGRIGTAHGYAKDTGSFCDVSMNIQEGWNDTTGLVSFLLEWVDAQSFGRE